MTFTDLIARFQSILNRDDCTNDAATIYLQDALARVVREARLPDMERTISFTVADLPLQFFPVPSDLIQVIDVYVSNQPGRQDDIALDLKSNRQLLNIPKDCPPTAYARFQAQFNVRGFVPTGAIVTLYYYGEFTDIVDGSGENELTASNPDLVIYGALSFAGDVFDHPSTERWEARYQQILAQVQGLGIDADSLGGATGIAPMYQE